jgi:RNA polymerase-interacting CarD/CdnL/TRCF family regulator
LKLVEPARSFHQSVRQAFGLRVSISRRRVDKVLDILDAEHKRLQAEWDASYKRFYEKEEQKRIERPKKAKRVPKATQGRKARGQKASPTVSSSRSKGASEL